MISSLRHLMGWIVVVFRSREDLILENLALRQQLLALHVNRPRRRLSASHKLFWIALRRLWSGWKKPLILVTPRTVVAWHGAGFRLTLHSRLIIPVGHQKTTCVFVGRGRCYRPANQKADRKLGLRAAQIKHFSGARSVLRNHKS